MGIFDGTSGIDSFTGTDATNLYRFNIANLSSGDTVNGNNALPPGQIDTLQFLTAGFIASSRFAGVTGIEIITLADGTNTVQPLDSIAADGLGGFGSLEIFGGNAAANTASLTLLGSNLTIDVTVHGGTGINNISTGSGADHLIGGANGADFLQGGAGADTIDGGGGHGQAYYANSPAGVIIDLVDGLPEQGGDAEGDVLIGIDHLGGSAHDDVFRGNGNFNYLDGKAGDDDIFGGAGNDVLVGGDGDDLLEGGAGADQIQGGTNGTPSGQFSNYGDFASYESSGSGVQVNLSGGNATGIGGDAQGDTLTGIENLIGSGQADILGGDANANILIGNGGADQLSGNGGDDYLIFDAADTVVDGGADRDTIAPTGPGDLTPVTLDLTGAAPQVAGGQITDVEVVDIRHTSGNSLTIDVAGVNAISGPLDKIVVFNGTNTVDIGSGWLQEPAAASEADPLTGAATPMTRYTRADGGPGEILIQNTAALTVDLADAPEVDLNGVAPGVDYTITGYEYGTGPVYVTDIAATVVDPDDDITALVIELSTLGTLSPLEGIYLDPAATPFLGGLTVTGQGTPTLTISGTAPSATYQTLLSYVQYDNSDLDPGADTAPRTITFTASDASTLTSAPVSTTITPVVFNADPILLAETQVSTNEDTAVTGRLPQAFDPDGDAVAISLVGAAPTLGSVVLNGDGTFTYTPSDNANGQDSFTIEAVDARGATTQAVVTVTIDPENDAPVISAINTASAPSEGVSGIFEVAVTDADGDTPVVVAAVARHGDVSFTGTTLTYTPDANFSGADKITVLVSDGNGGTAVKELSFTVAAGANSAPVVSAVNLATSEDHVLSGKLPKGTDADGDALSIVASGGAVSTTAGGTVTVNADGTFVYNPAANFNGNDTFTYQVTDGTDTTNVTVTIAVQAKNDGPQAVNDTASAAEGDANVVIDVLANDTDPDNTVAPLNAGLTIVAAIARHGDVTLTTGNLALQYTPDANFSGTDTIHYVIRDAAGATSVATVTVTVTGSNDAPVFSVSSTSATTSEDTVLTGRVPAATDADGDALTYSAGSTAPTLGSVTVGADGSYIYTPNANATGPDSFTVDVSDGTDTTTITVNVTIAAVNDAPTATNVTGISATEGGAPVVIELGATGVNAVADVDGDTLSVLTAVAKHGSVSFTGTEITYTPDANFAGNDTITYIVSDGNGGHAVASITVAVGGDNDAPVVAGLSVSGVEDQVLTGQLPAATDPDGDTVSYVAGTAPSRLRPTAASHIRRTQITTARTASPLA